MSTVTEGLKNIFDLTDVKLIKTDLLSVETIETLKQAPYCGQTVSAPRGLSEFLASDGGSVAALFLADKKDLGILLLMSQSPDRFTKGMGLVYLRQLAQLAAATMGRFEG